MLTRVLLIISIVIGLGIIALSQFMVRPQILSIIDTRDTNKREWDKETATRKKKEKELAETKTKLDDTSKTLEETQTQLTSAKSQAENESKRANGLQTELTRTKTDLHEVQQKIAAWDALGIPVEQVKSVIASEKKVRAANDALEEEKKVLNNELVRVKRELALYKPGEEDPVLPVGLKGKVLVVDPKWNFVVLDIGDKQGLVPRGVLLVSRNSKLIGKVRVMSTQDNRSIANIIPGWKLGDIMEGDQVLY
jgi:hypothetical protein